MGRQRYEKGVWIGRERKVRWMDRWEGEGRKGRRKDGRKRWREEEMISDWIERKSVRKVRKMVKQKEKEREIGRLKHYFTNMKYDIQTRITKKWFFGVETVSRKLK